MWKGAVRRATIEALAARAWSALACASTVTPRSASRSSVVVPDTVAVSTACEARASMASAIWSWVRPLTDTPATEARGSPMLA